VPELHALLALLLCVAQISAPAAASLPPAQLLQRAIDHRWHDKNESGNFTWFETWHNQNFDASGKAIVDESAKFESTVLNGKPYLHMTEQNGQPLKNLDATVEEHRYDSAIAAGAGMTMDQRVTGLVTQKLGFHIHLDLLPDYFRCAVAGTDSLNGRTALHLDCTPLRGHKPKDPDKARGLLYHLQVWIDLEYQAFARVDAELLREDGAVLPGTRSSTTWQPVDAVWLPATMEMHGQAVQHNAGGKRIVSFATEYTFTNYQRFRTDVKVLPK
jgi:hypothetical protein